MCENHSREFRRIVLVIVSIAGLTLASFCSAATAAGPQPRRGRGLARAMAAQRHHTERFLSMKDVVGTATGRNRNGQFVVKVLTRRPGVSRIPKTVDGVPVVVEATGEFYALRQRASRRAPRRSRDRRPLVFILDPDDGAVVTDEITVTVFAFDDHGVSELAFDVDGVSFAVDADGSDGWTATWDTTQVADGQHLVTVIATDTIGQTAADNVLVTVDNEPGPFSPDGRPTPIGVSVGNENECSAGTIGCRVRDAQGNVYLLSNNHVFARLNRARMGEAILQPGLIDSDCAQLYSDQVVGLLADFVPIDFRWRATNTVDAAIALSTTDNLGFSTPADGYGAPTSNPVEASVGQSVQKYGRSSLLTTGVVDSIEATVVVNYGSRRARFSNQIIVNGAQGLIEPGDSGSLLVSYDPEQPIQGGRDPVGLIFAGSDDGSMAIANPIQEVLDAFQVTIDGP